VQEWSHPEYSRLLLAWVAWLLMYGACRFQSEELPLAAAEEAKGPNIVVLRRNQAFFREHMCLPRSLDCFLQGTSPHNYLARSLYRH